ncbi:GNAT family N-acetyltransferase [Haloflavibacter putidus]|uniref:GNAT family N-acetyltransferase n=1 Tax=Haloflavibacter putidus TaxID=2576776 RepID=A0A507ZVM7_9FLAO|nr:GNAT family N-acetyltransferase [Haloflavibacter putidus]TQD39748.1 GNAT family N-acetyltransferase [Haloflavibacter putidus]
MQLEIIPAKKEHASASAELILHAMEDLIYFYIGEENKEKAIEFLQQQFLLEDSLYSYYNTLVAISDKKIVGILIAYDAKYHLPLQQKLQLFLKENYAFDGNLNPETKAGEFYLDALSVDPAYRGKKIGSQLIQFAEKIALENKHSHIGLLVDLENPKAKCLYERIGFQAVNKVRLGKHSYEHLQKKLD